MMHFTKVTALLLGLVAFVSALPSPHERRMVWTPRSLERKDESSSKNDKRDATANIDTTAIELTKKSQNSEVELTILVQEKIKIEDQKKTAKDNVRKNHYRNKNRNVNTIIIVITEIIDIRNSNNGNKRYMKHQLRADNKAKEDVIVQVTEVIAITISNSNSNSKGAKPSKAGKNLAATAASGAAANTIQTADPNAPFAASNATVLLPSGAAAPQGKNVEPDPAVIVEELSIGFVVQ